MAWDKGFNFRSSAAFVTDGANETYVTGAAYPVTRNGVTFGWLAFHTNEIDRDVAVDRRLAGINYAINTPAQQTFQVDLPATGDYIITLALGDTGSAQAYQYWQLKDGITVLATIADVDGTALDHYDDATGVDRTEANWPTQNATITKTFATTTLLIVIGSPDAQANSSTIAHLFLSQVVAAAVVLPGHGHLLSGLRNRTIQHV